MEPPPPPPPPLLPPHYVNLLHSCSRQSRHYLKNMPKSVLLTPLILVSLVFILVNHQLFHAYDEYDSISASSSSSSSTTSFSSSPSGARSVVPRYLPPVRLPEGCDVSKGEWVPDRRGPHYTNATCFTIQEHQNCMKFGRPDSDYLRWKWKPDGCELSQFDPAWFLEVVKGKSLAFVGDSVARNQMQSFMCLLSRVEYPKDVSGSSDENFKRMLYPDYNFTINIFWSPFLIRAHEADADGPNHTGLWNLYLDEVDQAWASQLHRFDYVVISSGNWFTRPSMFYERGRLVGCHYCLRPDVNDLTLRYSHRMAFRTALRAVNGLAARGGFRGRAFVRTLSPSHFENGEWNKGGNCVRTRPYRRNETTLEGLELELYRTQLEEFAEAAKGAEESGADLRLLDTTGAMLLRPDGHPSRYGHRADEKVVLYNDCVHWCLPGPIDMWNNLLFHMLS